MRFPVLNMDDVRHESALKSRQARRYAISFGASLLAFVFSLVLAFVAETWKVAESVDELAREAQRVEALLPQAQRAMAIAPPPDPPRAAAATATASVSPEQARQASVQQAGEAIRSIIGEAEREARERKASRREIEAARQDAAQRAGEAAWRIIAVSERTAAQAETARRAEEREALVRRVEEVTRRAEEQATLIRQVAAAARREAERHDKRSGEGAGTGLAGLAVIATALGTLVTGIGTMSSLLLAWRAERRQGQEFQLKIRQLEHQVLELDAKKHEKGVGAV
jgi:hypothetical protein